MMPRPRAAPFVKAYSSTPALDNATVACVLDSALMREIPADKVIAAFDEVLSGGGTVRPEKSALTLAT